VMSIKDHHICLSVCPPVNVGICAEEKIVDILQEFPTRRDAHELLVMLARMWAFEHETTVMMGLQWLHDAMRDNRTRKKISYLDLVPSYVHSKIFKNNRFASLIRLTNNPIFRSGQWLSSKKV